MTMLAERESLAVDDSTERDAFGRLRTSEILSQAHIVHHQDKLPRLVDVALIGTGTDTYNTNLACRTLATAADGDAVILQTIQRFHYQAGKSARRQFTFSGFQKATGKIVRVGYFSSSIVSPYTAALDGIFISSEPDGYYLNVYRNGTMLFRVESADWFNPLDGSKGTRVDWSKHLIFGFDFQYLGVGTVRFFVQLGKRRIFLYRAHFSQTDTQPYLATPNQPLRWELRQSGAGAHSFTVICAEASIEGGKNRLGTERSTSTKVTAVAVGNGAYYPVVAIQYQTGKVSIPIGLLSAETYINGANKEIYWELQVNPTLSAPLTYAALANSPIQRALGDGVITVTGDGYIVGSGYINQSSEGFHLFPDEVARIGQTIAGVKDQLVLVCRSLSGTASVYASLRWVEEN